LSATEIRMKMMEKDLFVFLHQQQL